MTDALLALMLFGPLVATYFLKSNAALGFMTLCVGFVLSTSVIGDLKRLLSEKNLTVTDNTLALILLLVPLGLTLLLTRRSSGHGPKFWLQLVAALCTGGLLVLSLGPILNSSSRFDLASSNYWNDLEKIQSEIIGIGAFVSLLLVWFGGLKPHRRKHTKSN